MRKPSKLITAVLSGAIALLAMVAAICSKGYWGPGGMALTLACMVIMIAAGSVSGWALLDYLGV